MVEKPLRLVFGLEVSQSFFAAFGIWRGVNPCGVAQVLWDIINDLLTTAASAEAVTRWFCRFKFARGLSPINQTMAQLVFFYLSAAPSLH